MKQRIEHKTLVGINSDHEKYTRVTGIVQAGLAMAHFRINDFTFTSILSS